MPMLSASSHSNSSRTPSADDSARPSVDTPAGAFPSSFSKLARTIHYVTHIGESQPKSIAAKAMGTPGSPEATRSAARSPAEDARTRPTEDDVLLVRRSSTPPLRAVHASPSPHSSTPETAHPSHHHLLPVLSSPAGTHQGGGGGGGGGGTARAPVALRGPSTWLVTDSGAPLASRRALARTWTPRAPARCLRPRRRRRHHHR
jgi:hypothetical protein